MAGFDKVTVKIKKYVETIILGPLTHLFNLSIRESTFPDKFKIAVVGTSYTQKL